MDRGRRGGNWLIHLGAGLAGAGIIMKAALWMGGSSTLLQWFRPDAAHAAHLLRMIDALVSLSIVNGSGLVLVGRRWCPPRLFATAALALACLMVSLLGMEVASWRLALQVVSQWGWSDDQRRADWMAYQGFDYAAVQRCRDLIAPNERVLVLTDGQERSFPATAFFGFYLMPRRTYFCWAWGPPQASYKWFRRLGPVSVDAWRQRGIDWRVVIRNGRIQSCRRFKGGRLP